MRRWLPLFATLALFPWNAPPAHAEGDTGIGVFLYNENVRYVAPNLSFSPGVPATGLQGSSSLGSVMGLGVHWTNQLGDSDWSYNILGAAGIGSEKFEQTSGGTTFSDKWDLSSYKVRFGVDYSVDVNDDVGLYCGPAITYRSTKADFKGEGGGSSVEQDGENYTEFGLDNRFGSTIKAGDSGQVFADFNSFIGYGSAKKDDDEVTEWQSTFGYRMGYRWLF